MMVFARESEVSEAHSDKKIRETNLCHCHNVRNNTMGLKSPEMAPCSGKPSLNLISYTKASRFLNAFINRRQVTWGQLYNATHSLSKVKTSYPVIMHSYIFLILINNLYADYLNRFRKETSNMPRSSKVNEILNIFSIHFAIRTKHASVWVGVQGMMNAGLLSKPEMRIAGDHVSCL